MRSAALTETLMLGALTGMRSMAGPAALAFRRGGILKNVAAALATGEMAADKTTLVGNRTDAVPLFGRAVIGAFVGGVVAQEHDDNMLVGALIGASAAVAMAHIAYKVRRNLPASRQVGGVLEDAVVIGIGSLYAERRRYVQK